MSRPVSLPQTLAKHVDRPGGDPALRALGLLHGAAVAGRFEAVPVAARLAAERGRSRAHIDEALLQVVAYGGFPRAIEALTRVHAELGAGPEGDAHDDRQPGPMARDGRAIWDAIYAGNAEVVLHHLDQLLPGFDGLVLEQAYARILSRPGLALGERELLGVAALALASLPRPLESHARGALLNGFAASEVQDMLLTCTPLADDHARTVIDTAVARLTRKVDPR